VSEPSVRNLELEAAAFANLDDVDNWRVYADWLQSVGDPRGELASLDLHRRDAFRSQRLALAEEIRERARPYVDRWHEWAQSRDLLDVRVSFKRGFVYEVEGALPQLRGVLDELFERDPIQRLKLREVDDDDLMAVLESKPAWTGRLRYLRLSGGLGPLGAKALSAVSLARLERLNLLGNDIDAEACEHLASLDTKQLEALTLTINHIDADALEQLLSSPARGQWRELYLSANPFGSAGLERLAATTGLEKLRKLYACDIGARFTDYAVLLDSSNLPGLEVVGLSRSGYWRERELLDRMRERWGSKLVLC
jgi:uncharacterized protein (TIGR02996 family)